jgi:Ca2+-dependent lipid-binding protein
MCPALPTARKLTAMDWNGFSDPYAAISFNGLTAQSTIKKANLNPDWHENFAFWMKPNPASTVLSVMVCNSHTSKTTYASRAFHMGELVCVVCVWLPLATFGVG